MPAPFPRLKAHAWLPAVAVLLVHIVLWKGTSAYDQIPTLDRATHFLGGVTAAWFLLCCMRAPWGTALFGRHSQLSEALDSVGLTRSQRTIDDTISDMALGLFGGGALVLCTRKPRKDFAQPAECDWSSEGLPCERVMIAESPETVSMPFHGEDFGLFVAQFGDPLELAERGKWVEAIVESSCVLTAAWGAACSAWDDDVDLALVEQNLDRGADRLIMTTWHESESLEDALGYFFRDAFGEDGRPHYYAVLVFGANSDQLRQLKSSCIVAMEALS